MTPIAVITKLKVKIVSAFEVNWTLSTLTMLAPTPVIEYYERPQSGLL